MDLSRIIGRTLVAGSLAWSPVGWGATPRGRITIIGSAEASAEPELARVSVDVTSLCYSTSREAKDANALLANRILEEMRPFALTDKDRIVATGGPNSRQTEVVPYGTDEGSVRYKTLCEKGWRATNRLHMTMSTLGALPDFQDKVLSVIDQESGLDPSRVSQTYAELSQPVFGLGDETLLRLQKEAHSKAYDDALGQLAVFKSRCALPDLRLMAVAPPQVDVTPHIYRNMEAAARTPIIPDEMVYRASWRFEWSYEAPSGCP